MRHTTVGLALVAALAAGCAPTSGSDPSPQALAAEAAEAHGDEGELAGAVELASFGPSLNSTVCSGDSLPELEILGAVDAARPPEPSTTCDATPKPGVLAFRAFVLNHFGCGSDNGIARTCGGNVGAERSAHVEGRAWDWGVSGSSATRAAAEELLAWLLASDAAGRPHANARRWGIATIIYNRRIWSASIDGPCWDGWSESCTRPCGSCAAMAQAGRSGDLLHLNHVHFSFSHDGAAMQTSFFTGGTVETPQFAAATGTDESPTGDAVGGASSWTLADGNRVVEPGVIAARRAAAAVAEAAEQASDWAGSAWSGTVDAAAAAWPVGSVAGLPARVAAQAGTWYDSAAGLWRSSSWTTPSVTPSTTVPSLPGWQPAGTVYPATTYSGAYSGYAGSTYPPALSGYAAASGLAACWNAGGACELESAPAGLGDCRLGIVVCSGSTAICTRRAACASVVAAAATDAMLLSNATVLGAAAAAPRCTPTAEQCNGLDDDCDGQIDEAADLRQVEGLPCPSSGVGGCQAGTMICAGGELHCQPRAPAPEVCNGLDDDCNGTIDDVPGGCAASASATLQAAPEICNGRDEDLDGFPDNGNPGGGAPCTLIESGGGKGTVMCTAGELRCVALSFEAATVASPTGAAASAAAAADASDDPGMFGCTLGARGLAPRTATGLWGLLLLLGAWGWRRRRFRLHGPACRAFVLRRCAGQWTTLVAVGLLWLASGCGLVSPKGEGSPVEQTLAAPSLSFSYDPSVGLAGCQTVRVLIGVGRGATCATGDVVELDLETEYLPQVVACEMPASWHPEALKAQAVAARGYVCHNKARGGKGVARGCADVTDDTSSQMYSCGKAVSAAVRAAVESTRGQILLLDGRAFETEYSNPELAGHGRGLNQPGAQGLAQQGGSYDQILATYYGSETQLVGAGGVASESGLSTYAAVGTTPIGLPISNWTAEARAAAARALGATTTAAGNVWDGTVTMVGDATDATRLYFADLQRQWDASRGLTSPSSSYAAASGYQPVAGDLTNSTCLNRDCNNELGTVALHPTTGQRYCYSTCSARLASSGLYANATTNSVYGAYPVTAYNPSAYATAYAAASTVDQNALLLAMARDNAARVATTSAAARCVPTAETCNGLDDDCDGQIDEAADVAKFEGLPCPTDGGQGACYAGTTICAGGELHCQARPASPEVCDGFDNDCNGTIDDVPGGCATTTVCTPQGEQCNGLDDDCDGFPDNGNPGGGAGCTLDDGSGGRGTVMCAAGQLRCVPLVLVPTPAVIAGANPLAGLDGNEASAALGCRVGPGPRPRLADLVLGLALATLVVARLRRRLARAATRAGDSSRQPG